MFIDFKNKFIYVRTQKTGSSAIIRFLKKNKQYIDFKQMQIGHEFMCFDNRDSEFRIKEEYILKRSKFNNPHAKLFEIARLFEREEQLYEFKIITSIRNPFIHAISFYRYQRFLLYEQRKNNNISLVKYFLSNPLRTITQYFFSFENKFTFNIFLLFFYKPYTDHFFFRGKNVIDNFIRMEHLEDDLQKFFDDQRIDLRVKTRKSNANGKINSSGDLKYLYGPWSKRFISKKYKKIIKDFDYDI